MSPYTLLCGEYSAMLQFLLLIPYSCSLMDHDGLSGHGSVMTRGELVKNGIVLGRVFAHADDTGYRFAVY